MRYLFGLAILVGLSAGIVNGVKSTPTEQAKVAANPKAIVETKYGSIVRLVQDGSTFCSGTVITKNLIVTAAHCVLEEDMFGPPTKRSDIDIRPNSNKDLGVKANVVYATPQMDQAILTGDFHEFETRPYITDPEQLTDLRKDGNGLVSCGYPLHGNLYCTVNIYRRPDNFFWATDGVLIPGMSGGPTMINGVVVAVNTAVEGQNSIVSPIYNITASIKEQKK